MLNSTGSLTGRTYLNFRPIGESGFFGSTQLDQTPVGCKVSGAELKCNLLDERRIHLVDPVIRRIAKVIFGTFHFTKKFAAVLFQVTRRREPNGRASGLRAIECDQA